MSRSILVALAIVVALGGNGPLRSRDVLSGLADTDADW